jgi:hypothetical protein
MVLHNTLSFKVLSDMVVGQNDTKQSADVLHMGGPRCDSDNSAFFRFENPTMHESKTTLCPRLTHLKDYI